MDTARYSIALFIIFVTPGVFLYWFSIHWFVDHWRGVGANLTLVLHIVAMLIMAWVVWLFRAPILETEFGTNPVTIVASVISFIVAATIRIQQARQFTTRKLVGLSELQREPDESDLVTEGIYARIRHPRYLELIIGFFGYAFFANYLATYLVAVLSIAWAVLLVRVEERELIERFGDAYVRYRERTPRFIPRW